MPSTSERQRKFMGAELARKRAGKGTKTGMSEQQLREFAGSVHKSGTKEKPGHSIIDVEYISRNPESKKDLTLEGYYYKPGETGHIESNHEHMMGWHSREIKSGPDYSAEVVYYGPDTDYYVEEINPQHYGRDYEPAPLKDLFKTEDKAEEEGIRLMEEFEYSEQEMPGAVNDDLEKCTTDTWGANSYKDKRIKRDRPDYRTFDDQKKFRRSHNEIEHEFWENDEEKIARG
jgi:hypothetical protein